MLSPAADASEASSSDSGIFRFLRSASNTDADTKVPSAHACTYMGVKVRMIIDIAKLPESSVLASLS